MSRLQAPLFPLMGEEEAFLYHEKVKRIIGVDEAGRGPLAGPVVAAACILPRDHTFHEIRDSKQLSSKKRQALYQLLTNDPEVLFSIAVISHEVIDEINIHQATLLAMRQAVGGLTLVEGDYLLVDGYGTDFPIPHEAWIKGDQRSRAIAAASILAKETRDALMREYDEQWPQYGFAQHMGYGTAHHLASLRLLGPCPIHRRSFAPIKAK